MNRRSFLRFIGVAPLAATVPAAAAIVIGVDGGVDNGTVCSVVLRRGDLIEVASRTFARDEICRVFRFRASDVTWINCPDIRGELFP